MTRKIKQNHIERRSKSINERQVARSRSVDKNHPRNAFVSGVLAGLAVPSIFLSTPVYGHHINRNGIRDDFRNVGSDIRTAMRKYRLGAKIEKTKTP